MKIEHRMSNPYRQLLLMAVLSFASMFILMYAMVARFRISTPQSSLYGGADGGPNGRH